MEIHEAREAIVTALNSWRQLLVNSWQDRAAAEFNSLSDEDLTCKQKYEIVSDRMNEYLIKLLCHRSGRWSGGMSITNMLELEEQDWASFTLERLRDCPNYARGMVEGAFKRHEENN